MSEGASYGASGTSTSTESQGSQAPEAQKSEVLEPGEISAEQNVHNKAQEDKGLVFKKIQSSLFCFDCGRKAEYFAINFGKWEKYLCAEDLHKEIEKAKTEGAQSQQGSTQPPPQTK